MLLWMRKSVDLQRKKKSSSKSKNILNFWIPSYWLIVSRDLAAHEAKAESWTIRLEHCSQPHPAGGRVACLCECDGPAHSPFHLTFIFLSPFLFILCYLLCFLPPEWLYGMCRNRYTSTGNNWLMVCGAWPFIQVRFIYHKCFLVLIFRENSKLFIRKRLWDSISL